MDILIDAAGHHVNWTDVPKPAANTSEGKKLFTEKGCLACHSHSGVTIEVRDAGGEPDRSALNSVSCRQQATRLLGAQATGLCS